MFSGVKPGQAALLSAALSCEQESIAADSLRVRLSLPLPAQPVLSSAGDMQPNIKLSIQIADLTDLSIY